MSKLELCKFMQIEIYLKFVKENWKGGQDNIGCRYKTRDMDYNDDDFGMKNLAKKGNKSIKGLINKDVAIKKRRNK